MNKIIQIYRLNFPKDIVNNIKEYLFYTHDESYFHNLHRLLQNNINSFLKFGPINTKHGSFGRFTPRVYSLRRLYNNDDVMLFYDDSQIYYKMYYDDHNTIMHNDKYYIGKKMELNYKNYFGEEIDVIQKMTNCLVYYHYNSQRGKNICCWFCLTCGNYLKTKKKTTYESKITCICNKNIKSI